MHANVYKKTLRPFSRMVNAAWPYPRYPALTSLESKLMTPLSFPIVLVQFWMKQWVVNNRPLFRHLMTHGVGLSISRDVLVGLTYIFYLESYSYVYFTHVTLREEVTQS